MTEVESSTNIKAEETDALGSSPDEAPASPQKVNESINEKTGIEPENAIEGAAADLTLEESESVSGGHRNNISSADDTEVSEAEGLSNVDGSHISENNHVDLGDKSETTYEKFPENDKEIAKTSAVDETALEADTTVVEQHLSSGNDEASNLSHEKPAENTVDENEITKLEEEKVFHEADPTTERTEAVAHHEDEQLSSSDNDTDLRGTLENHAVDQDPHVSIKGISPETVSMDLTDRPTSLENEHESKNFDTILQPTVETSIGAVESGEDLSLNKEASGSENAVFRNAEDPSIEEVDANGEVYPIGDKETTAIPEGSEGALKPEDSIADDAVIRRPLHDTAENSNTDELDVSSSEIEAKIPEDQPKESIEDAEKQEIEEETGAQGSPVPWHDDLSENVSPNKQDITLEKVADEGNISPNAEALESENISFTTEMVSEGPISYEDLIKEESASSSQDASSSSESYDEGHEVIQTADSVAASDVGEQQENKSDSSKEQAIETEAISQGDTSVTDGQEVEEEIGEQKVSPDPWHDDLSEKVSPNEQDINLKEVADKGDTSVTDGQEVEDDDLSEKVSPNEQDINLKEVADKGDTSVTEGQEVEEETGAQKVSPDPWHDDLSEKASPNEQDITLKEVADKGNISPNAEALERTEISDGPISYENLIKEESASSIQDGSSNSAAYDESHETIQKADLVAPSEVGEQQENESHSLEEHAIDTEADKSDVSQVDASVTDGQDNGDAEDSQETHLIVGAEPKDEKDSATEPIADYSNFKENTVQREPSYNAISKENTVPNEATEREFSDNTQQEVLADLGADASISDDTIDSVLSHRELSEKDAPVQIGFTSPYHDVQGYDEINQTGRADEVEEPKDQSDVIADLPSLEKTLVSDSDEVSEESFLNDKEIEQAESKDSAGDLATDPDSYKTLEDGDKMLSSVDDSPEEIVGNEQNITRSSNEAVASKEDNVDSINGDARDKQNDVPSMQETLISDNEGELSISYKDDGAPSGEHDDLACNKENADAGSVEPTGVSADSPAFQNPEEPILSQSKEPDMENGYFSDEKHPEIIEEDGSADQFERGRKHEDLKTCASTDNVENFGKAEVEERSDLVDSEAALSEDSQTVDSLDAPKECSPSHAAGSDEHDLFLSDLTAKDRNADDVVPSETESADEDLSVVQKDEYASLPKTETHASVDPISATNASSSEMQEHDILGTFEADAQETSSDPKEESSDFQETPTAQESDESESPEALTSIPTDQKRASTDKNFAELDRDEVLQERLKDSKENEIEGNEVDLEIDSSNTGEGISAPLENVPEHKSTSEPVKDFAEGPEQIRQQGDEAVKTGQDMEAQDLQNVPGKSSSSIPLLESGQGDEISREQPFSAQNSLPDPNDQNIQEKLLEGAEILSPEDETKNQVNSSTETADRSINEHSSEAKVKQSEATDDPSAYQQQTDISNPATLEEPSDRVAKGPTLPVSTFSEGKKEFSSEQNVLPSNGTTLADEKLGSTLQHPKSSPASETKVQRQGTVEEEHTKPGVSFPWSLLLCCSSQER